jgi:BolA protein
MTIAAAIGEKLASLHPESIEVLDESGLHAGHAGARDGGHFRVAIVAGIFSGKGTLARHRLVYDAAGELMRGRIHALSIDARAPDEV